MELAQVCEEIKANILLLAKTRDTLKERAQKKADAIAEYKKQIAITLMKLEQGQTFVLDNEQISNPPKSIMNKLAEGICYKYKIEEDLADTEYKSAIVAMQSIMAIINGYQSILRYQDET